MQLARFRIFVHEITESNEIKAYVKSFAVYRLVGDIWYDHFDNVISDEDLIQRLDQGFLRSGSWREPKSQETFFSIPSLEAFVVTVTNAPTRTQTRTRLEKIFETSLQHANDAFDASHDALTGLLNAKTIDHELLNAVDNAKLYDMPSGQIVAEDLPHVNVALLSIDLDNFKQVNDSYGHDYGDIVLACFANRLENAISTVQKEHTNIQLVVGRSGGEEFFIVVNGPLTEQSVQEAAEDIRRSIESDVLPNDSEWESFSKNHKLTALMLPHITERRITASIGISSILSPSKNTDTRSLCANLRREADAALYRAKAGGRNVVRFFPAIREQFGTVLEHHGDTGTVVIDIGTHVSVHPGHEFHVFHPDFIGDKPFVFSDGRSKKRLGTYPRNPSGQIVVFDAQKEISFCQVAEIHGLHRFPVGSVLQFIPIGSITHLISQSGTALSFNAVRLSPTDQLEQAIERSAKTNITYITIVFTLLNLDELESSRGVFFVNQSLANLFRAIEQSLNPCAIISQIGPAVLAVFLPFKKAPNHVQLIARIIEQAELHSNGLSLFGAGVYYPQDKKWDGDASTLSQLYALDYARYAAVLPGLEQKKIEIFTPSTVNMVMANLRKNRKFAEVIADYRHMKEKGIENAFVENHYALACFGANPSDAATSLAAATRANELKPDENTIVANLAMFEFVSGHIKRAHQLFTDIPANNTDYSLPSAYLKVQAMAAFELYKTDTNSVDHDTVISLLRRAVDTPSPLNVQITNRDIQLALEQMPK